MGDAVIVVGGAGYVGSHVVHELRASGYEAVVVDDLSTGSAERIGDTEFIEMDIASASGADHLIHLMTRRQFAGVLHLAARKSVAESVRDPELYQRVNVAGTHNVVRALAESGIPVCIFSSTAAVYAPAQTPAYAENSPAVPLSPYGATKLGGERILAAACGNGLRGASLRYFNVAGCGEPGLREGAARNLIPSVLDALERDERPVVFGADHGTPDGTCVRDYVHVSDVALAHVKALGWLADKPPRGHTVMNLGTGRGHSVLEVIHAAQEITGKHLEPVFDVRRHGDLPEAVADVTFMRRELGWAPALGLRDMIRSEWEARGHTALAE